jgi:hypothetical protein
MALPTFLCVGAEKGGTTPLARILSRHRDVFVSPQKETHYFSRHYDREDLVFYEARFFQGHRGQRAIGELTPDYMRHPELPARVLAALGRNVKLIFCLRDPVTRAFSHYLQCSRILVENESFEQALLLEPQRLAANYFRGLRQSYVGGSLYAAQVERFLRLFPRENLFFMLLEEDFQRNRAQTVDRLMSFLGVDRDPSLDLNVADTSLPPPTVTFVDRQGQIVVQQPNGTSFSLPPGAIVFRTGNSGLDRVITQPSEALRDFLVKLDRNLTRQLSAEVAHSLYHRFGDDVSRMEEVLQRDLSLWRR